MADADDTGPGPRLRAGFLPTGPVAPAVAPAGPAGAGTIGAQLRAGAAPTDMRRAWSWLGFAAAGFLAGQIVAAIFAEVTAAVAGKAGNLTAIARLSAPPEWYVVSTLFGVWVGFGGSAVLASALRGRSGWVRDLGLRFRPIDLLGVPIGVAGQYLIALMYLPFRSHIHDFTQQFQAPGQRLTGGSHGAGFVLIAVLTVVCAPFVEEVFFRGLLLRSLARLFERLPGGAAPAVAVAVTGVLFGLAHAESLQLLGLATFGIILAALAYRTGRLGMGMVAHASFNLVAVISVASSSGLVHPWS